MSVDLSAILPNIQHSLDGTGFLFGSGTSLEAGYPMMAGLTKYVVGSLNATQKSLLDEVLKSSGLEYKDVDGTPNIEEIADLAQAHLINSNDARFGTLVTDLRDFVRECILSVADPNLDAHCKFFELLKKRTFGLPCTVWIFTTNYDLLFETAASRVGVHVENGFSGTTERFFNAGRFSSVSGEITGGRFTRSNSLTVKLIKLHGSVSWACDSAKFYERHSSMIEPTQRVMVLPRRKKVMETLIAPYDTLFTIASRVLGTECKYLVSCGFSYSDDHINQNLLIPLLQQNKYRLFSLTSADTDGINALKSFPCFQSASGDGSYLAGKQVSETTELWKFSNFVKLF